MHFDDRIATVLRQPVAGGAIARIHFRQLLDLLGSRRIGADAEQLDAAYLRLNELSTGIPASERAQILSEPHLRLRESRLVAHLASAEPAVAEAAIAAARLSDDQWVDLIPALPASARAYLRRRDDLADASVALLTRLGAHARALPPAEPPVAAVPDVTEAPRAVAEPVDAPPADTPPDDAPTVGTPMAPRVLPIAANAPSRPAPVVPIVPAPPRVVDQGIGAIVKRIEEFHKSRRVADNDAAAEPPHVDVSAAIGRAPLAMFDFTTDPDGRIDWAEPDAAPMAVGLRLAGDDLGAASRSIAAAFADLTATMRHRQPIRAAATQIAGAPAIAGEWRVDAVPQFDPQGGRFVGYSGRMRRPAATSEPASPEADRGLERMRQILHELRTPVNAIQGFAEVIQQQLFGATPHDYRALAASIAGDSARILSGFEDLDRLIRLDTAVDRIAEDESDFAAIVATTVAQLDAYTQPRSSGFIVEIVAPAMTVALPQHDAEQLAWRILATLAGATAPGEMLRLRLRPRGDGVRLAVRLPESMRDRDEENLLNSHSPQPHALATGMFGAGFTLRLAAAEAKAAGGELEFRTDRLRLTLPGKSVRPATAVDESTLQLTEAMVAKG